METSKYCLSFVKIHYTIELKLFLNAFGEGWQGSKWVATWKSWANISKKEKKKTFMVISSLFENSLEIFVFVWYRNILYVSWVLCHNFGRVWRENQPPRFLCPVKFRKLGWLKVVTPKRNSRIFCLLLNPERATSGKQQPYKWPTSLSV